MNRIKKFSARSSGDLGSSQDPGVAQFLTHLPFLTAQLPWLSQLSLKKRDGLRMYIKKQQCFFCDGTFTKISRHLGPDSRNILKKKFLLNCHFLLIFKLKKKVKNILYSQTFFLRIFLYFFLRLFLRQNLRRIQILEKNLLKNHR